MTDFNWKDEILLWIKNKRTVKPFQSDLIDFFQKAFDNTSQPEKSLFGTTSSSISVLVGGIYLAAIHSTDTVSLLLDKEIKDIDNAQPGIAKSTKNFEAPLYWLSTTDLTKIRDIIKNKEIWESYYRASYKIFESKTATAYKSHIAKNKIVLSDFWNIDKQIRQTTTINELEIEFQEKVEQARKLSKKERQEILTKSNPKPTKTITRQTVFNRNQYVVAEVLDRASGICERCKKPAPFTKDNDNKPYLEVHHIIPLAEDGDDTVENAIGLCPNCHRHAHYGKNTY